MMKEDLGDLREEEKKKMFKKKKEYAVWMLCEC